MRREIAKMVDIPTHVGRQYLGNLGKIDNRVVSVTSLWADEQVYYPLETEPYTPESYFAKGRNDPGFRTKLKIALHLVEQAVEQSYKQVKHALGWSQYQVRSDQAIRFFPVSSLHILPPFSLVHKLPLVLRSLNPVIKESAAVVWGFRRSSPHPGLGSMVELNCRYTGGLFNLARRGKTLPSKGIAAEETPPPLLQIEPTRSSGNEEVMEARMCFEPGARL
jgi:hypothetical protein